MPDVRSYAEYGEDLVLWGALEDVRDGFYIDVGAADPLRHTVTKLFYDRGWSGINIEPRRWAFVALTAERPRDINLQLIVSDHEGAHQLHEIIDQPGLSTILDDLAASYLAEGFPYNSYSVPCRPLAAICEEHAPPVIHFLKIDVEGAERLVLEGCDFDRFRPWLLAIESTIPCTLTPCHEEWEHLVTDAGYELALAHQINRYYVAREHADLKDLIKPPPDPS